MIEPSNKKQARRRKAQLVAPTCKPNCQINHTIDQIAALLQCSPKHVRKLIADGEIKGVNWGTKDRKHIRVPHPEIRKKLPSAA
jgi:excisionase family DNA binding protein